MRAGALAVLVAALGLSGSSARAGPLTTTAKPDLPLEGVITNPDWAEKPSGDDVSRYYPAFAVLIHLSGASEISCLVATTGRLTDCAVVSETPAGLGFGPAAIGLSHLFRMKPRLLDGQPVTGGQVRIPIRFQMTPDEPAPSGESAPAPASPSALALSRRLVALWPGSLSYGEETDFKIQGVIGAAGMPGLSREQRLAIEAFQQAVDAARAGRSEQVARVYAAAMPEPVLAEVVAFLGTPAGKAWATAVAAQGKTQDARTSTDVTAMMVNARSRLCRQIACLPQDTPPAPATTPPSHSAPAPQGARASGARTP